jgi:hypothetical protein
MVSNVTEGRGREEEEACCMATKGSFKKKPRMDIGNGEKMHASLFNPFHRPSQCNAAIDYKHGGPSSPIEP